ncbi:1-acyl-sn-glycerol-3-phosphate acyltransferase, partial [Streptomyces sp. Termitarium-T10T-6]
MSTPRIRSVNPMCDQRIPASIVLTCTDHHPSAPATARGTRSRAAGPATTPEEPLSRLTVIKAVLGPILRLMFRPQVEGAENIPGTGPVILAGNHLTFIDSMVMPVCVDRPVFYIGKDEYVTGKGAQGPSHGLVLHRLRHDPGGPG